MCEILVLCSHFSAKPEEWSVCPAPCIHYTDSAAWPQINLCSNNLQLRGQWVNVTEQEIIMIEQGSGLHTEKAAVGVFVWLSSRKVSPLLIEILTKAQTHIYTVNLCILVHTSSKVWVVTLQCIQGKTVLVWPWINHYYLPSWCKNWFKIKV